MGAAIHIVDRLERDNVTGNVGVRSDVESGDEVDDAEVGFAVGTYESFKGVCWGVS